MKSQKNNKKFTTIKLFLVQNADPIQKEATRQHKKHIGTESMRIEFIEKYQNDHIKAVQMIGEYLEEENVKKGVKFFNMFGEQLAKNSVHDGLSIEEAIDGT